MASYTKEPNGTYTLRYRIRDRDGKSVNKAKRGFERRRDAKLFYDNEIIPTLAIQTNTGIVYTLSAVYTDYLEHMKGQAKNSTYILIKSVADKFIIPKFGARNIFEITSLDAVNWQTEINNAPENYSYRYKAKMRYVFVNLLNFSKYYGLKENPFDDVKSFSKSKERRKEMLFWTREEFEKFIAAISDERDKMLFSTLYLSGARNGEAIALTWKDIDFEQSVIKINKTYSRKVLGKSYDITAPKTPAAYRDILMPAQYMDRIKELYKNEKQIEGFSDDWFIFGREKPVMDVVVNKRLKKYCELSKVKKIRVHDLRHSHVSLLIYLGCNILIIAYRLGHKDTQMTLNIYGHMFPNNQKELIGGLNFKF
jgi:integrase